MQSCTACGQTVQDVETYCPRCGGGQLQPEGQQEVKKQKVETPKKQIQRQETAEVNIQETALGQEGLTAEEARLLHQTTKDKESSWFKRANRQAKEAQLGIGIGVTSAAENTTHENGEVVTVKEFLILYLTLLVPFYGVYKFIKAVIGGPQVKQSITNSLRASLIVSLIGGAVSLIAAVAIM